MARIGLTMDRKFRRLARALDDVQVGFGEILARGALELLWDAAYEAADDYIGDRVDVETAAHWRGRDGVLLAALLGAGGEGLAGFIDEGGDDSWPEGRPGTYRVHDLWDHAPEFVERRAKREAEREAKGESLSELRSAAGKKGRAKQLTGNRSATNGQTAGVCPENEGPDRANGGQKSTLSRPAPPRPVEALPAPPLPVPGSGGEARPVEARPAPPHDEEARASGSGRMGLGILGAELIRNIEAGMGTGLVPLQSQAEAEEFERVIALRGGPGPVYAFIARTVRERDTRPRMVSWIAKVVKESMPVEGFDA